MSAACTLATFIASKSELASSDFFVISFIGRPVSIIISFCIGFIDFYRYSGRLFA